MPKWGRGGGGGRHGKDAVTHNADIFGVLFWTDFSVYTPLAEEGWWCAPVRVSIYDWQDLFSDLHSDMKLTSRSIL